MKYTVKEFYEKRAKDLRLQLVAGAKGLNKAISRPVVHRPGLSLTGYYKSFSTSRIYILGRVEISYLKDLDKKLRLERLDVILREKTPAVIVARKHIPPKELVEICQKKSIPLFRSSCPTLVLINRLILFLEEVFAPTTTVHGTLVEVFGIGVLIQGQSSIGKSEAALGLLERGHRLISDDIVRIKRKEGKYLVGSGPKLTRHLMEIRGIGILNVAHLYGAVCVRPDKSVDLIVKLEEWNKNHFYDRVGLTDKLSNILGVDVPMHILPVKPGRDVILLIETISLQHRLKDMGYNSAREFHAKLLNAIGSKQKKKVSREDNRESKSYK